MTQSMLFPADLEVRYREFVYLMRRERPSQLEEHNHRSLTDCIEALPGYMSFCAVSSTPEQPSSYEYGSVAGFVLFAGRLVMPIFSICATSSD
jgi:hypothetical protein